MSGEISVLIDDGMQIERGTGIGKYSEHLGRALASVDGVKVDYARFDHGGNRRNARLSYLRHINSAAFRAEAEKHDLCVFTNYAMPFRKLGTATAVTVHDLAVFDCPDTLPRLYLPYGRAMIENAVRRADTVVTVSETMARDIRGRFPREVAKLAWVWPGVYDHVRMGNVGAPYDDRALGQAAESPFFLMVGTVEKRKNVELVIRAFAKFKAKSGDERTWKLILAGRPGFGFDDIEKAAGDTALGGDVVFTGYVSDNDCANLYRDARALVFPSVYEGFGSIQNECMSMGLPIVLSDIPTNREVSRDYGVYFKLGDADGLARALDEATELRGSERLSNLAHRYLPDFNWESVAKAYLGAVRGER